MKITKIIYLIFFTRFFANNPTDYIITYLYKIVTVTYRSKHREQRVLISLLRCCSLVCFLRTSCAVRANSLVQHSIPTFVTRLAPRSRFCPSSEPRFVQRNLRVKSYDATYPAPAITIVKIR